MIVYVSVVIGVCGLRLNAGKAETDGAMTEISNKLDLTEIPNIDELLKLDQVEILCLDDTDVSDIPQLVRNMPQPETDLSVRLQKFQGHICVVWSTEDARSVSDKRDEHFCVVWSDVTEDARSVSDKRDEHFCVVWSDVTRVALCRWDKSHRHLFSKRK